MTSTPTSLVDLYGNPLSGAVGASASRSSGRPTALSNSFRNASRDRTRSGSATAPLGSPNAHHDRRTLEKLIRDCDALSRNNDLARAFMGARVDHVVGGQITPEARTKNKDWNRQAEQMFGEWANDRCDIHGIKSLTELSADVVRSWDKSGGKIAHKVVLNGRHCKIELIDVIRLMNEGNKYDTKHMHGGVEISPTTGRAVAYWIADFNDQGTALDYKPTRHDASTMWLINDHAFEDSGQHRTPPRLSSIIDQLEALSTARRSALGAYQLATFMALLFTRNLPEGQSIGDTLKSAMVASGEASSMDDAEARGPWQPMTVWEGGPNEDIKQVKPEHPSTAFDQVMWSELQVLASAMGLPLELTHMRFIRNFSASRSALAIAWKKIQADQRALERRFLTPVYHWFIANEIRQGRLANLEHNEWKRVEWMMPCMPMLDPIQEIEAQAAACSAGFKLHETALRELGGGDRAEFLLKKIIENKENALAGINYGLPLQTTRSQQTVVDDHGEPVGQVE